MKMELTQDIACSVFDFALIEPFIAAVKKFIQCEDQLWDPSKKKNIFLT